MIDINKTGFIRVAEYPEDKELDLQNISADFLKYFNIDKDNESPFFYFLYKEKLYTLEKKADKHYATLAFFNINERGFILDKESVSIHKEFKKQLDIQKEIDAMTFKKAVDEYEAEIKLIRIQHDQEIMRIQKDNIDKNLFLEAIAAANGKILK